MRPSTSATCVARRTPIPASSELPPLPAGHDLPDGLWAGALDRDPRPGRRGRTRRWSYSAAGSDEVAVGAAVVDLGFVATAFAWCLVDGRLLTWDARGLPRVHASLGARADTPSRFRTRGARVVIGPDGDLDLDVPVADGRLVARVGITPDQPAVCVTPTPAGGWNTTQKVAGESARVHVQVPGAQVSVTGGAWRDWTVGAQDRDTTWRWAAGAGRAEDGRRVGLNASTGMNGVAAGEDVVWWDGRPHPLEVAELGPVGRRAGDWHLAGPGWSLDLASSGARAADENLLVVRSRYVQPVGTFTGTLPDPAGRPVAVRLVGVTEDHLARW